jgi:hypothetical protein
MTLPPTINQPTGARPLKSDPLLKLKVPMLHPFGDVTGKGMDRDEYPVDMILDQKIQLQFTIIHLVEFISTSSSFFPFQNQRLVASQVDLKHSQFGLS